MAGREVCGEGYLMQRDEYPSMALEFVLSGEGTLKLKGRSYHLLPGMIFTYGPGIPHEIRTLKTKHLVKCFVDFSGSEAIRLLRHARMMPGNLAIVRDERSLGMLFDLILEKQGPATHAAKNLCADYLRALLRLCAEQAPLRRHSKSSGIYRRAATMIDEEFLSITGVADVAERLGVSPEHLCRTFREMDEDPPSKRISIRKMNRAAELLISGGWKVKEVSYHLGYATPFHFSTVFKRHFGVSPRSMQQHKRVGVTQSPD